MSRGTGTAQGRYLYERLSEKDFQRLCGALIAHEYPGVRCYPVGHSDGGRDITREDEQGLVVYQVKWTSKPEQDPVSWLKAAIAGEAANILRLAAHGASTYHLITSVAGTAVPDKGMMDRLDTELRVCEARFGIPVRVWWRSDVDARVDKAPAELKWTNLDMLGGQDLARYFVKGSGGASQEEALRRLVRKVVATQWEEDAKTKFKQIDLTDHNLDDLFIDVEAVRLTACGAERRDDGPFQQQLFDERPFNEEPSSQRPFGEGPERLGGAAAYLLDAPTPFTLVRGAPGQGKSTLGQYVCQRHRDAYIRGSAAPDRIDGQRLPLRIDLSDYAAWLAGHDPLGKGHRARTVAPRTSIGLEEYLSYVLTACSGGLAADAAVVHTVLDRFPVLLVLDGLDEVASKETRLCVVGEIDRFAARLRTARDAQLVVTTRPNAGDLAEPSPRHFEVISLSRLSRELQNQYFGKWVHARSLPERERLALERTFLLRATEPHVAQLADNAMQLSILLYLMRKRTDSVPKDMTGLYTSYLEIFLDREAEKSPTVARHRDDLEEVTAFLGWRLAARAEADAENGRMSSKDLKQAILNYLFEVEKDPKLFEELFTGATDRVWALTEKTQGTFEFDVQPMREYFAARFLREFAGADQRGFDSGEVLRALVRRSYWLNTCRFYAGFAKPNELSGMLDDLEDEFKAGTAPEPVRAAAWTLLADGVFNGKVRAHRRAAALLSDDLSVRLLSGWTGPGAGVLPELTPARGGNDLARELLKQVDEEPTSRGVPERARLAASVGSRETFDSWWHPRMNEAAGGERETLWLSIGAAMRGAARLDDACVERLALTDDQSAFAALAAGVTPAPHSAMEQRLLRLVLDGHAPELALQSRRSYLYALQEVLRPARFLNLATQRLQGTRSPGLREQEARARLLARDERYAAPMWDARDLETTALWGDTAHHVKELFGPCWLAAEIAVCGAVAASRNLVVASGPTGGTAGFGDDPDYGVLLQEVTRHRHDPAWWSDMFAAYDDDLSRGTWALALVACARRDVIVSQLSALDQVCRRLPSSMLRALLASSSRIVHRTPRRLRDSRTHTRHLDQAEHHDRPMDLSTLTLLSHVPFFRQLKDLSNATLADMARFGDAAWPAVLELTARLREQPSQSLLDSAAAHGPGVESTFRMMPFELDGDVRAKILDAPFDYPRSWVLAAAAGPAPGDGTPRFLEQVALDGKWFTS